MKQTIYITRNSVGSIHSRGLASVYVWFFEPCINVENMGEAWSEEYDEIHEKLKPFIYGHNCKYNFLYRSENDVKSDFGDKLIRNDDGIDFPEELVKLKKEYKVKFIHDVFGSGHKTNYRPNTVANMFGYSSDISLKIWDLILEEFSEYEDWMDREIDTKKPWWLFCKKLDIEIKLPEYLVD